MVVTASGVQRPAARRVRWRSCVRAIRLAVGSVSLAERDLRAAARAEGERGWLSKKVSSRRARLVTSGECVLEDASVARVERAREEWPCL